MSLRFGSGWLVIYFLICSCTFICSAHPLRARDYTTFNPFEPLPFSVTPDTRFWVTFSPLQARPALTVEVTRPRELGDRREVSLTLKVSNHHEPTIDIT